jgi:hypothetical protein
MIEIDKMPRFTLRNMRGLFKNAKKLQEALLTIPEENRAKLFKLFDEYCSGKIELAGVTYHIKAEATEYAEIASLLFEWENDGRKHRQRILIVYEPSNLGISAVPYFLCPVTYHKCRKLYTDGNVIVSRFAFSHTYSQRNKSHKWRELDKYLNYLEKEPTKKNGKTEYRGKLTPYGKRIVKYYENMPKEEELPSLFKHSRRGRPPKPVVVGRASSGRRTQERTKNGKTSLFLE